ncbi:MAG: membrane protein [Candidatus Dojkabacteria bacterium]|nr:MAG: membrane protein [Candidatus Dojkabacteria bacterium]
MKKILHYFKFLPFRIIFFVKDISRNTIGLIELSFVIGVLSSFNYLFGFCLVILVLIQEKFLKIFVIFGIFLFAYLFTQNYVNDRINETRLNYQEKIYQATVVEEGKQNNYSQRVILNVETLKSNVITELNKYPTLLPGQKLSVKLQINPITEKYNKSYVQYLNSKNIFLEAEGEIVDLQNEKNIILFFAEIKQKIINKIKLNTNEPETALFVGITTGFDNEFSDEYKQMLQKTGTSHIVAVSGFNFMIIFSIIMSLKKQINRRVLLFISFFVMLSYLLFVGTTNFPAMRASIMISFIIFSELLGRPKLSLQGLLLSLMIILLLNPLTLKNVSFQLSFMATLSIILFNNKLKIILEKYLPSLISEIASISTVAFLGTSPIVIYYFNQQSLISILANLAISEIVSLATITSIISIILYPIPFLSKILFSLVESILKIANLAINLFSNFPEYYISNYYLAIFIMIIFFILIDFTYLTNDKN